MKLTSHFFLLKPLAIDQPGWTTLINHRVLMGGLDHDSLKHVLHTVNETNQQYYW